MQQRSRSQSNKTEALPRSELSEDQKGSLGRATLMNTQKQLGDKRNYIKKKQTFNPETLISVVFLFLVSVYLAVPGLQLQCMGSEFLQHVGSSSLTWDGTQTPCIESSKS